MTRARARKQVIRARAARTGERYTAARRHVLRELNQPPAKAKDTKKKFVIRERDGLGRCRYKWNDTTVQLYLIPKGDKTTVTVQHTNLAGANGVDEFRAKWKAALGALADQFDGRS